MAHVYPSSHHPKCPKCHADVRAFRRYDESIKALVVKCAGPHGCSFRFAQEGHDERDRSSARDADNPRDVDLPPESEAEVSNDEQEGESEDEE